jgi:putative addiction module killer protein
VAIQRLPEGLGNIKRLSSAVSEVKIDYGPGYRLYFTRRGDELIVLLCGGDKGSQRRDVEKAEEMATEIG